MLGQERDAEVAVAGRAGVRRAPCLVVVEERLHDDLAEAVARIERDVRDAERVAGGARPPHGVGRAARARRIRGLGIDPQAQRDADGRVPRSTMRWSATAESTPPDMATAVRRPAGTDGSAPIASAMASARASSATAAHSCRSAGISRSAVQHARLSDAASSSDPPSAFATHQAAAALAAAQPSAP